MRITFSPKISLLVILIAGLWAHSSEAQWIRVNGPYVQGGNQGYPQQLVVNGDEAIIATNDGVFVSKDSGKTWIPINNGLPTSEISRIATIGSTFFVSTASGLYSSNNRGVQWSYLTGLPSALPINWIQSIGSNLYAAADTGVYFISTKLFLSNDTGRTWKALKSGLPGIYQLFSYGPYLLAGTDSGVFRSLDSGLTWIHTSTGIASDAEVLCFASIGSMLFAGANDTGVYLSNDSGKTWSNGDKSIPWNLGTYAMVVVGNELIAADDDNGLLLSHDSGKTWRIDTTIYPNVVEVIGLGLVGSNLVAACDFTQLYSQDSGVTWKPSSSGFGYEEVSNIVSLGQELFCSVYYEGIYRSIDSGLNWTFIPGKPPISYNLGNVGTDLVLATDSGVSISNDSGVFWTLENDSATDLGNLTSIGPSLFSLSYSRGILYSSDEGATWDTINGNLPQINKLSVLGNDLIASNGYDFYISISKSNGWSQITVPQDYHNGYWTTDGDLLYLLENYNGLFVSSDIGKTWTRLSNSPPANGSDYTDILAHGNTIFVASYDGTYLSSDSGRRWQTADPTELPYPSKFSFADGYIFGITQEQGLFRQSLPNTEDIVAEYPPSDNGNDLISINPNPATDRATINFSITQASMVSLTMSDVTGKEFPILQPQWMEAGEHTTEWTTDGHADGMYICRLEVNGTSYERKLILQR